MRLVGNTGSLSAIAIDMQTAKIANNTAYQKIFFRPRILRKIAKADCSTTILGQSSTLPLFISPA